MRIPWFLYPVVLAVGTVWFAGGGVEYYLARRTPAPVAHVQEQAQGAQQGSTNPAPSILTRNLFGLDTAASLAQQQTSAPAPSDNLSAMAPPPPPAPNIYLRGVLIGDYSMGLILYNGESLLIPTGKSRKGVTVHSVTKNSARVTYEGKTETLTLAGAVGSAQNPSMPAPSDVSGAGNRITPATQEEGGTIRVAAQRDGLKRMVGDVNMLLNSVLVTPYYDAGKFAGYRLSRMAQNAPLRALGLTNGDIVKRINGEEIKSPDVLFNMLSRVDGVSAITIDVVRRQAKKTIFVDIK